MSIALSEVNDEQLLAEVARRQLNLHDNIDALVVKETYDIGKVLGHGASGEVLLVTHKESKQKFACKVVKKNRSMNDAQTMSTEIEIMKRLRHENIVSLCELYESPKCLWIVLELVDGGDLTSFLARTSDFNEVIAARLMGQILQGVHYLHSMGVVHRDLKLDNILMAGTGSEAVAKIADFGLSALLRIDEDGYHAGESGKRKRYRELDEMWGTKEFFAPEVISQAYGPQADVWALGCVLFEMLCGEGAFNFQKGDTESALYKRIASGDYDLSGPNWKKISSEAKDLLTHMLHTNPTKRFTASECLLHPWVTGKAHTKKHQACLSHVQKSLKSRLAGTATGRKKARTQSKDDKVDVYSVVL
eukprot:gene28993-35960_t